MVSTVMIRGMQGKPDSLDLDSDPDSDSDWTPGLSGLDSGVWSLETRVGVCLFLCYTY